MHAPAILLLEDQGPTVALRRLALVSQGWRVRVVDSVVAALEAVAEETWDAIVASASVLLRTPLEQRRQFNERGASAALFLDEGRGQPLRAEALLPGAVSLPHPLGLSTLLHRLRERLPPELRARTQPQPRRVLVVDDDSLQRKLLAAQLAQLGFEVESAPDGIRALELLERQPVDAVIADTLMPKLNGFSLSLAIQKDCRLAKLPVVLTHAVEPMEPDLRLAENVGAYRLVPRVPGAEPVLIAVLEALERGDAPPVASGTPPPIEEHLFGVIRQLESERERLFRDAQDAVRMRDDFIAIAAHELRTPLTAMQLQLQAHRRGASLGTREELPEREDSAHEERTLQSVERGVRRLSTLVSVLLDATHADPSLPLELQPIDLREVLERVVERSKEEAAQSGCAVRLDAPETVQITADPERLEQVMDRLLANAFKFGVGSPVQLSLRVEDTAALISVRDDGVGIAPEMLSRIFGRFERAASSQHYGGLGLGLYLVERIVQAHGGTVTAESIPGDGATFTVRLPRVGPLAAGVRRG